MTGWRNTDLEGGRRDDEDFIDGAWLVGLALLAVLAIGTFVLIAVGLIFH